MLKLSPDQAERLWQAVERMCRQFRHYRAAMPLPGAERAAMLSQLRRLSSQLDKLADGVAAAPPHVAHTLREVLGPILAERLSEIGFWETTGSFPVDRFSIHDLDLLKWDRDPTTSECDGIDRISANDFLRRVEIYQLGRRQNAAVTEAAAVLTGLIRALNRPLLEYLELAKQRSGGATGQPFRNAVIRQLAQTYRELTGKKPTGTPRGAFANWCERILDALGMSTEGLEAAIQRQLSSRRE